MTLSHRLGSSPTVLWEFLKPGILRARSSCPRTAQRSSRAERRAAGRGLQPWVLARVTSTLYLEMPGVLGSSCHPHKKQRQALPAPPNRPREPQMPSDIYNPGAGPELWAQADTGQGCGGGAPCDSVPVSVGSRVHRDVGVCACICVYALICAHVDVCTCTHCAGLCAHV